MRFVSALLVFLLVLTVTVTAQDDERRIALVIGNAEYIDSPLRNPGNDATDVGRKLASLGFEVTVLTNATHEQMEEAAYRFGVALSGGGVGLFFYSGHGAQYNGENYLIPVDAKIRSAADLRYKALSAGLVMNYMSEARNRLNMILLDACRDNPFEGSRNGARGLAAIDQLPAGSMIVYATGPGKTALDGAGNHSPFTEAFLQHIDTPGIGVKKMFDLVGQDVAYNTLGEQRPWISHDFYDEFSFADEPVQVARDSSNVIPPRPRDAEYGELYIVTEPDGAQITINDEAKGQSPLFLPRMPLQTPLRIEARKEGYSGSTEVTLTDGELVDVMIELAEGKGNLIILSSRKDVAVYIDGRSMGQFGTGLFRDVPAGSRNLELRGDGIYWQGDITITANQTVQVQAEPRSVESGMEGVTRIDFRGASLDEHINPAGNEDWYLVTIGGLDAQYLFTAYTTGDTDTYIEIYGPDDRGNLVSQNDDSENQNASATVLANNRETYWIKVRGYSAETTGAYVLNTKAEAYLGDVHEPNDSQDRAVRIGIGESISTNLIPGTDVDWFEIPVRELPGENEFLTIETSGNLDTVLTLYYGDNEIAYSDDDGEAANARITIRPERTGSYYAEVRNYDSSSLGVYELSVDRLYGNPDRYEPDNSLEQAGLIEIDGRRHLHNFTPGSDSDWIRLDIEERQAIEIRTLGSADTYFNLYDRSGDLIAEDDDSGDEYNARLTPTLDSGVYYLEITQLDESLFGSEYEVVATPLGSDEIAATRDEAVEMSVGSAYNGRLSRNGQEDWYTFELGENEESTMIRAYTTGETDTYIEFYGPNDAFNLMAENDDAEYSNARVVVMGKPGGRYWVKVRGYDSGTTGAYVFHIETEILEADRFEPNNSQETAVRLGIDSQPIASNIVPGTDVDWFEIRVPSVPSADSYLNIETRSSIDTVLELYYERESVAYSDDGGIDQNGRIIYRPERPGLYYAVISTYDDLIIGDYEIEANWIRAYPDSFEPDNEQIDAKRIEVGGSPQRRNFTPGNDVDWVRLDVSETGTVEFRTNGDADTYFELYTAGGEFIAEDDDGGTDYNARLSNRLSPGTYYLKITQVDGESFGSEYEVIAAPGGAEAVDESRIVEMELDSVYREGMLSNEGEADLYTFQVRTEGSRIISIFTTGNTDTYIELYGPNSPDMLNTENDDGDDGNAKVSAVGNRGDRFWVLVRGYDTSTTGSYALHIESREFEVDRYEPNDSIEQATQLNVGERPLSASIIPGSDRDWYRLRIDRIPIGGSERPRLLFIETSGELDTVLELYTADEYFIMSDDDGGDEANARIVYPITDPGTYYVQARQYDGSDFGPYEISAGWRDANPDAYEPDDSIAQAPRIAIGREPQPRNFSPGNESDWVRIDVDTRRDIQIMTYGETDTYLTLYDGNEELIAEDDDSGSDWNALLRVTLDPGRYFLKISQVDETFEAGYELMVQYGFSEVESDSGH